MKKKILIIAIIISVLICMAFVLRKNVDSDIIYESLLSGGKVDNSNLFAPKTIESKTITELSVSFYIIYDEISDDDYTGFYDFKIEEGILREEHLNISEKIDSSLIVDVQSIIEKYNLVKMNGVDVHTAGLPPEYQPYYFNATYDSGEKLYFSKNNDPRSPWARELFEMFRSFLIEQGHSELEPSKEALTVTDFYFDFNVGEKAFEITPVIIDDEVKLMKTTSEMDGSAYPIIEYEKMDDELFFELSKLIVETNLKRIDNGNYDSENNNEKTQNNYFEIHIDFKNGKQIYGSSTDSDRVSDFQKDAIRLLDFFNLSLS